MYKLSIVIPVYNLENYIDQCIDSILKQYRKDIEIILVNDGSTDTSLSICKTYQKENLNIKIIDKKNGGVSSARNLGLEVAKGKYIFFLDGDDYLVEKAIDKIINKISEEPDKDIYIGGKSYHFNDNILSMDSNFIDIKRVNGKSCNEIFTYILGESTNTEWAVWRYIFKKEYLESNNLKFDKEIDLGEDLLFVANSIINTNNISVLNFPIIYYRLDSANSITKKLTSKKIKMNLIVCNKIIKISNDYNFSKKQKKYIGRRFLNYYFKMLSNVYCCKNNIERDELEQWIKKDLEDKYIKNKFMLIIMNLVNIKKILFGIYFCRNIKLKLKNVRG